MGIATHLQPICDEGRLPSLPSASEYRKLLARAGFHQVDYLDLTASVKKTWSICAGRFIARFVTDPALRRRLRDPNFTNGIFAKTVFRIWLAYRIGSMRFGYLPRSSNSSGSWLWFSSKDPSEFLSSNRISLLAVSFERGIFLYVACGD